MRVSEEITITDDMIKKFSDLTGDKNPIHLDDEYAKNTVFGKRIAHGMLISSFFSKIIAEKYPGKGSIYLNQEVSFKNPCFVNDTIEVVVELIKKEKNKYFLKTIIKIENKTIVEGSAVVLNYNIVD
jgi:acyl dehydratase